MKKRILTESNTKRFMKLASIGALSDKFINETTEETMEESEETVTETDDASLEEGGMYKKDDKMEETVEENIEETTELTEAETVNVDVVELVDSILSAVSDATGVEMSREGGEEEGEPELGDEPMGDEPMGDEPMGDEPMGDEPDLGGEEEMSPPVGDEEEEEPEAMMQEEFINEVTRRVAKRLLKKLGKS